MTETTGCKKCKEKDSRNYQWLMVIFGFYILISSIYGTKVLIEKLMDFFK